MADFETDLQDVENGIVRDVVPMVEHFTKVVSDLETITEGRAAAMFGGGAFFSTVQAMSLYESTSTAAVEGQRAVVGSLEAFREALEDVVRTYRAVDEGAADGFRGSL
ncbi:hypothetical protein [Umezawaea tangerina]|uniref:Excreted virulence factor EspC (Type VII ESX diderm) n=1 Tax=Umezawaea tangerina TaxID=84725 RepID=A0A2T0T6L9_9PSEU|nr:hypothetical protein [Umezawaea tangerina]PRY41300.1 hypothetical protein CLV43_10558 [Umezawaea tangerina]